MDYAALILKNKRAGLCGQVIVELMIIFLVVSVFIIGVVRLWVWSNSHFANRQPAYEETRLSAGSSEPGRSWDYTPGELTDDWVFKGEVEEAE